MITKVGFHREASWQDNSWTLVRFTVDKLFFETPLRKGASIGKAPAESCVAVGAERRVPKRSAQKTPWSS